LVGLGFNGALVDQRGALRFGTLALGDVPDRAGDEHAFLGLERAQADLDRELRSVLPPAKQLQAGAHRPDACRREVAAAMTEVGLSEALGHEDLDQPAEELCPWVPEQPLSLRVDEADIDLL